MMNKQKYILPAFILSLITLHACNLGEPEKLSREEEQKYWEKGKKITATTFGVLSSNLQKTMKSGGVKEAIQYCNVNAYPLTDSLSEVFGATIKRVSHRPRNPENAPEGKEEEILKAMLKAHEASQPVKPLVVPLEDEKTAFFAPIYMGNLCVKCHGDVKEDIGTENYKVIESHYPEDKATGFKPGDLRGMWSIKFNRKKN